jgi:hypothetical protein
MFIAHVQGKTENPPHRKFFSNNSKKLIFMNGLMPNLQVMFTGLYYNRLHF